MTKQVNEQLFDELNRQENIIKAFRETFSTLERKKLVKLDGNEEFQKLRSVLGVKNWSVIIIFSLFLFVRKY